MKKKTASIVAIAILIAMLLTGCSGHKRRDVGHDPNGFLGYSDDFWEWYAKNN